MLNPWQFILLGVAIGVAFTYFWHWLQKLLQNDWKTEIALAYLYKLSVYDKGNHPILLALLANSMDGYNRQRAIWYLLVQATQNNSVDAFYAIKDYIHPKDLRYTMRNWIGGYLKGYIRGGEIGMAHGMKLVCLAEGFRTIEHLNAALSEHERAMLMSKYSVDEPFPTGALTG